MLPTIPEHATLTELQQYQADICKARGWDQTTDLETFLLFSEEVGELAKAIRNQRKLYQESEKEPKHENLAEEFADVMSYLMELANRFDVNLEAAYSAKERKNANRKWE